MPRAYVIGIMGPGEKATDADLARAGKLGTLIAKKGWITLTGGRTSGVMEAALIGAKKAGGQTIGILSTKDKKDAAEAADIVIVTGLNSGRNIINVLTSDVVVACGVEAGTASEISFAIKEKKPTILLTDKQAAITFFRELGPDVVKIANSPEEVIQTIELVLTDV